MQRNFEGQQMESLADGKRKSEKNLPQNSEAVTNDSEAAVAESLPLASCASNYNLRNKDLHSGHENDKTNVDSLSKGFFPSKSISHVKNSHDVKSFTKNGIENNDSHKDGQSAPVKGNSTTNNPTPVTDETSSNSSDSVNNISCGKDTSVTAHQNITCNLSKTPAEGKDTIPQDASSSEKKDDESSQTHYSYLSICLTNSNSPTRTSSGNREPLARRNVPTSRYPEEAPLRNLNQRPVSQSRPSSPPPATYFPSCRRPSLSLPPSPQSARVHRASLPANAFATFNVASLRGGPSSTHSSPSSSRARTPTPPPINRRSPRRRSARTPSPRPPLPPQATNGPPAQPQQPPPNRNRQECQPYKMKMRSR